MRLRRKELEGKCAQGGISACDPTLDHPNDEDLSLGTPKPQKQKCGEGEASKSPEKPRALADAGSALGR
jgi:hypothetical protein